MIMKNATYIIVLFLFYANSIFAQQSNIYQFNYDNQFINNPAATAPYLDMTISGIYQKPFTGIDRAPANSFLAFQLPFRDYNMSIGGLIENQTLGVLSDFRALFSYSYKMKLGSRGNEAGYVSFGVNAQFDQLSVKGSSFSDVIDQNDPILINTTENGLGWNVGLGLMYSSVNKIDRNDDNSILQLGLSTSKALISDKTISTLRYRESRLVNAFAMYSFGYYPDLFIKGLVEGIFENSDLYDVRITASALFKEVLVTSISYDLNQFLGFEVGFESRKLFGTKNGNFRMTAFAGIPVASNSDQISMGRGIKLMYLFDVENF